MKKRTSKPHGRVGARTQARLKKWSGKVTRTASAQNPPPRKRPLDVAKEELRRLFR